MVVIATPLQASAGTACLPGEPVGIFCFDESGYDTGSYNVRGIDGYIRSSTTTSLVAGTHRGEWVDICDTGCTNWGQIGAMQGQSAEPGGGVFSPDQTVFFVEWHQQSGSCDAGDLVGYGQVPAANNAYYLYEKSGTASAVCGGGSENLYLAKVGSATSSPLATVGIPTSAGRGISRSEIAWEAGSQDPPPHGTTYFGTESEAPNSAYGLHIQTSVGGTWSSWTSSNEPSTNPDTEWYWTLNTYDNFWSFYNTPSSP